MVKLRVRWVFIELLSAAFGALVLFLILKAPPNEEAASLGILVLVFLGLPCMRWLFSACDKLEKMVEIDYS